MKQMHSRKDTKDNVVSGGSAVISIPALESALSTPGAFDLTSCFQQLASPQPPLSTNTAQFLNVTLGSYDQHHTTYNVIYYKML